MNYKKNYYDYISYVKSLNRSKQDNVYYEKHHILPKSLGGNDEPTNLVLLTAREHYLAHYLLCKFTTDNQKKSMLWAFHRMAHSDASRSGKRKITSSRLYQYVREQLIETFKTPEARVLASKRSKDRIWVNNGVCSKMIKKEKLDAFLNENKDFNIGRLGFVCNKPRKHKKTGPRKSESKRYWMYKSDESKDIMVPLDEISSYESLGWRRGRLNKKKSTMSYNIGKIRVVKDGVEKLIEPELLEQYMSDNWVRGRKPVSETTKQKMSDSHKDPNGKTQIMLEKVRSGEIKWYHPKNITLYKDGQYMTIDTNKIDPNPYFEDGWIKKGKPKSKEWKEKMSKSMMGNTNGFKKKP